MKDSDGNEVVAGDIVSFSFGIPPVGARGKVFERAGKLMVSTPRHNPKECTLFALRRYAAGFWKVEDPDRCQKEAVR